METSLPILELGAVLLAAATAGWIARRLGLPAVIGYLVVGIVVSPFTPGYVADREQIQLLADVGVVLLLFEVGIELDVGRLRQEHRGLLLAAPLQVALTTAIGAVVFAALGLPVAVAAVLGLAVALSSSVVIVNITRSARRTTDRPTETALLGWSLLQDLTGVLLAAALLAFAAGSARPPAEALLGLGGFALIAVVAARLLPRVLHRLRPYPDLFLIVSIAAGLVGAGIGAVVFGVPLALAAFVAGLMISDTPDSAEVRRRLLPFRDVFAVLFFVAVGTLLDPGALGDGLGWLAVIAVLLVAAKTLPAFLIARGAGIGRPGQVAVGLSQIGEFSFVIASVLAMAGLIDAPLHAALLAAVALSIGVSAVAVRLPVRGWTRHTGASLPA
ncbi:MAG: cation:proton antiporter [Chloroflexota bacterium]